MLTGDDPAGHTTSNAQHRLARVLRIEWLGQTAASLLWIVSVLTYGLNATGDWLQLCAASAWLLANIAALVESPADRTRHDPNLTAR